MDGIFSSELFWAQIIGFFAMMICITAWQLKNSRHIILCYVPANTLWAIQYLMLGAPMGAFLNICAVAKDCGLGFAADKYVKKIIVVFLLVVWGTGLYLFNQWYDILPILAATILNIALIQRDNRSLYARACIATCLLWMTYNIIVHSWMAAACACFVMASSTVGMIRYEGWVIGRCYRSFLPSLMRSLFVFPNFRTYP